MKNHILKGITTLATLVYLYEVVFWQDSLLNNALLIITAFWICAFVLINKDVITNWIAKNLYQVIFIFILIFAVFLVHDTSKAETIESTEEHEEQEEQEEHTQLTQIQEEVVVEPKETVTVAKAVEKVTFYNVPLSEELQLHIFAECEKHNIAPAIIIAMIERESEYTAGAIGDNGNSFGLMQIQPRWNRERMDRLGCNDLLDPFQNVTVGIDIVAELKGKDTDLYWVLMAYNGWTEYANARIESGNISEYALGIAERASELEKAVE